MSKLICTSAREASRSPTPRAWTTRASLGSGSHLLGIVSSDALTLHFHNTRGLGLVNVMAAFDAGALRFDAALSGLGGYPFAPGSSGNVCTEDLVNLCQQTGIETGLDLEGLIALSRELPSIVAHPEPGQVAKAGLARDLHPMPTVRG